MLPAAALLAAVATAASPSPHGRRFPMAPPAAFTGGFGEPTCQQCHAGNALNDPAGALELRGLPEEGYEPGHSYELTIVVRRPGMARGGFEAAARFAAGADSAGQAGSWRAVDGRTATTPGSHAVYIHHTELGSEPSPDSASWTVEWTAPTSGAPVAFHVVANAANGDESPFDDYVYAKGWVRAGGAK
ncbi:MAG TPA: choice-of-anchor V domain-containing protein [Gemmatimonadaceae bacterium]|nr:choice-of-anchor V domain-containing protein [Gemmatimonadaceae bacterium]